MISSSLSSIWKFLNYWYFRYLMVTELYMVEKWERAVCNSFIVLFCCILTIINCTLLSVATQYLNPGGLTTNITGNEIHSPV